MVDAGSGSCGVCCMPEFDTQNDDSDSRSQNERNGNRGEQETTCEGQSPVTHRRRAPTDKEGKEPGEREEEANNEHDQCEVLAAQYVSLGLTRQLANVVCILDRGIQAERHLDKCFGSIATLQWLLRNCCFSAYSPRWWCYFDDWCIVAAG